MAATIHSRLVFKANLDEVRRQATKAFSNIPMSFSNKIHGQIIQIQKQLAKTQISFVPDKASIKDLRMQIERELTTSPIKVKIVGQGMTSGGTSRVYNNMGAAAARARPQIMSTTKALKDAAYTAEDFTNQMALAVRRFSTFLIPTTLLYSIGRAFDSGIKSAIDFSVEMRKLTQIMDNNASAAGETARSAIDIGIQYGVSAKELLNVAVVLKQAGSAFKGAEEITNALEAIAATQGLATFGSMEEAADGLIASLNQFNMTGSDSIKVINLLNQVSKETAVESQDLVEAIKRGGGVFAAMGGNMSEFVSMISVVREKTRLTAEEIGRLSNTLTLKLSSPSVIKKIESAFSQIKLFDDNGQLKKGEQQLKAIGQVWGQLDRLAQGELIDILGGIRSGGKVGIPLFEAISSGEFDKVMAITRRATGSSVADLETYRSSVEYKLNSMKATWEKAWSEMGSGEGFRNLIELISKLGSGLSNVLGFMNKVSNALPSFLPILAIAGITKIGSFGIQHGKNMFDAFKRRDPMAKTHEVSVNTNTHAINQNTKALLNVASAATGGISGKMGQSSNRSGRFMKSPTTGKMIPLGMNQTDTLDYAATKESRRLATVMRDPLRNKQNAAFTAAVASGKARQLAYKEMEDSIRATKLSYNYQARRTAYSLNQQPTLMTSNQVMDEKFLRKAVKNGMLDSKVAQRTIYAQQAFTGALGAEQSAVGKFSRLNHARAVAQNVAYGELDKEVDIYGQREYLRRLRPSYAGGYLGQRPGTISKSGQYMPLSGKLKTTPLTDPTGAKRMWQYESGQGFFGMPSFSNTTGEQQDRFTKVSTSRLRGLGGRLKTGASNLGKNPYMLGIAASMAADAIASRYDADDTQYSRLDETSGKYYSINQDRLEKQRRAATTGGVLRGAGAGLATGAMVGSVVPGWGTAIGAVVGGVIGGIVGGLSGQKDEIQKQLTEKLKVLFTAETFDEIFSGIKDIDPKEAASNNDIVKYAQENLSKYMQIGFSPSNKLERTDISRENLLTAYAEGIGPSVDKDKIKKQFDVMYDTLKESQDSDLSDKEKAVRANIALSEAITKKDLTEQKNLKTISEFIDRYDKIASIMNKAATASDILTNGLERFSGLVKDISGTVSSMAIGAGYKSVSKFDASSTLSRASLLSQSGDNSVLDNIIDSRASAGGVDALSASRARQSMYNNLQKVLYSKSFADSNTKDRESMFNKAIDQSIGSEPGAISRSVADDMKKYFKKDIEYDSEGKKTKAAVDKMSEDTPEVKKAMDAWIKSVNAGVQANVEYMEDMRTLQESIQDARNKSIDMAAEVASRRSEINAQRFGLSSGQRAYQLGQEYSAEAGSISQRLSENYGAAPGSAMAALKGIYGAEQATYKLSARRAEGTGDLDAFVKFSTLAAESANAMATVDKDLNIYISSMMRQADILSKTRVEMDKMVASQREMYKSFGQISGSEQMMGGAVFRQLQDRGFGSALGNKSYEEALRDPATMKAFSEQMRTFGLGFGGDSRKQTTGALNMFKEIKFGNMTAGELASLIETVGGMADMARSLGGQSDFYMKDVASRTMRGDAVAGQEDTIRKEIAGIYESIATQMQNVATVNASILEYMKKTQNLGGQTPGTVPSVSVTNSFQITVAGMQVGNLSEEERKLMIGVASVEAIKSLAEELPGTQQFAALKAALQNILIKKQGNK